MRSDKLTWGRGQHFYKICLAEIPEWIITQSKVELFNYEDVEEESSDTKFKVETTVKLPLFNDRYLKCLE